MTPTTRLLESCACRLGQRLQSTIQNEKTIATGNRGRRKLRSKRKKLKIDDFIYCGGTDSKAIIRRDGVPGQRSVVKMSVCGTTQSDASGDFP